MWFGELPTVDATGAILAHSIRLSSRRIKKGSVLDGELIRLLLDNGHHHVTVARLDDADIPEDNAAILVANAVAADGVVVDKAHTGRVNLFAAHDGLLCFDRDSILGVNSFSEAITFSTLPENTWVLAGRMIATCKIITYGVRRAAVEQVIEAATDVVTVKPPSEHQALLIQTCLPSLKSSVLDKTRVVTENRLGARSAVLANECRCDHDISALCELLMNEVDEHSDWILIVGASAISDRRDVIPAAIEAAGGSIVRFGLPVDPGNLLLLGELAGATVIGLPGCARSPKYNGLDQLLDRLACKVPIDNHWLNSLGVGGLLTEMIDRPQPRLKIDSNTGSAKPVITGLVLAAGSSRRAGSTNKLLVEVDGLSMVRTVVNAACHSRLDHVVVVTGHQHELVEAQLAGTTAKHFYCPSHASGLAHSLSHGISRVGATDAVMVCLGDMPHVSERLINQIVEEISERGANVSDSIVVPVVDGKKGNPVVVGNAFFDTLLQHTGDTGAKTLMQQYPDRVIEIEVDNNAVLIDYDTPEALQKLSDA